MIDLPLLVKPTPSRGRTLRELTVNVFHPFELLPSAWETGEFDWHPENDAERARQLEDADAVLAFAQRASDGWNLHLLEAGAELDARNPVVTSPRGRIAYSTLLTSQRWHAAFHYRQLKVFLEAEGMELPHALATNAIEGLGIPPEVS